MEIKNLKWLYPGMFIKRWISLVVLGIIFVSMGFVIVIFEQNPNNKAIAGVIIVVGIVFVIIAVKKIVKSVMTVFLPQHNVASDKLVDKVFEKRILDKGPKIVVIGGGTGLSTLLMGLKKKTRNLTAIVTVADDGGSSGRLREEFGVLPPGDIRNCLVALSDSQDLLGDLFQFRFSEGKGLHGHSFGNLFITALSQVTGDFAQAIKESSKVLAITGKVYPATLEKVKIVAKREDGSVTVGECQVRDYKKSPIDLLSLSPDNIKATQESVEAIQQADAIILGPGSLYTSVMPNLLIEEIKKTIVKSKAYKIYICNIMTEEGETDHYSVSDHVRSIIKHTHHNIINHCIANVSRISKSLYKKYELEHKFIVALDKKDEDWFNREKIKLIKANIAGMKEFVRHDEIKLADIIMDIINN